MQKQLPIKYYLSHFNELLDFINTQCAHLLEQNQRAYLEKVTSLDEQSMCLLLRLYSRKPAVIAIASLNFIEIPYTQAALATLIDRGLVARPSIAELDLLIEHLTKPDILALFNNPALFADSLPKIKKSASKRQLVTLCKAHINRDSAQLTALMARFVLNSRGEHYEYLQFLYAGRLNSGDINHQNQFVMRDLGIARVRENAAASVSRFSCLAQAKANYQLNQYQLLFKQCNEAGQYKALAEQVVTLLTDDEMANSLRNKLLIKLYKVLKETDPRWAFSLLANCQQSPEAHEFQIRERYKAGDRDWVQAALIAIIADPLDDALLYFAEDFLQRKFNKQSRSRLTQMLADAQQQLRIDDIYRGDVEQGVAEYYQQQGNTVFYTENTLWLSLFALVFWQELYIDTPHPLCNEFDVYPPALRADNFFQSQHEQITDKLANIDSAEALYQLVCKNAAHYYEQLNGLFRWHTNLLAPLRILILHSNIKQLKTHLLQMTKTFKQLKDGYPDLMVLKNNQLYFAEIKAPGDKLRRNQLISIETLKKHGFLVNIVVVDWFNDPERIYSVVDIETTGSLKGNNKITEIAVVQLQAGEVIRRWSTLINPQRTIPYFITQLTGITDQMVEQAPCFADVLDELKTLLRGSVFVAHNVNFDYGFIRKQCVELGEVFKMPKLCTVVEARKAFPKLASYSLANLSRHFELTLTDHHRALADASATAELLLLIQQQQAKST
ncbi:exonuclease domain-containing protein [Pseudoalteromonas mariniglutinosa]|uniref:exonuclease domain-containing protein n=1 Tax=Pseudoalteromonas mariniglutinosa TaxID=206042 RepID=UPI00384B8E2F